MDADREMAKFKWLLIAGALFFVSCFMVYDEAAYLLNGQDAEAKVINTFISSGRRPRLNVEDAFTERVSKSPRPLYRKAYLVADTDTSPKKRKM